MMINKKRYYRIKFVLKSAMNIGCGENTYSDRDVIKNSLGKPYIPGSSLSGIYRSIISAVDNNMAKYYFGDVSINKKTNNNNLPAAVESSIKVYDANVLDDVRISKRDCVGLDEYKTAKDGAKFDFEVVEPGTVFVTYIEQDYTEICNEDVCEKILADWAMNGLNVGSKTMRGLGKTEIVSIDYAQFDMTKQVKEWIDFDMYSDKCWSEYHINTTSDISNDTNKIVLSLKQKGGISIRKYTTEVNKPDDVKPDYSQLTVVIEGEEKPVIPGTSWAGTFKHQMEKNNAFVMCQKNKTGDTLFGSTSQKSKVLFSESIVENAKSRIMTRTAINRFTAGAAGGALYTEKYYYGGTTELVITYPTNRDAIENKAVVSAIFDLHFGFMALGGLTAVGRGMFEITEAIVNGKKVSIPDMNEDCNVAYNEWLEELK